MIRSNDQNHAMASKMMALLLFHIDCFDHNGLYLHRYDRNKEDQA